MLGRLRSHAASVWILTTALFAVSVVLWFGVRGEEPPFAGGPSLPLWGLAVSFFVRTRGAKLWAAITLGLVALQVTLGFSITDVPYLGLIHGANALAIVLAAVVAALRVRRAASRTTSEVASSDAVAA